MTSSFSSPTSAINVSCESGASLVVALRIFEAQCERWARPSLFFPFARLRRSWRTGAGAFPGRFSTVIAALRFLVQPPLDVSPTVRNLAPCRSGGVFLCMCGLVVLLPRRQETPLHCPIVTIKSCQEWRNCGKKASFFSFSGRPLLFTLLTPNHNTTKSLVLQTEVPLCGCI